MTRHVNVAGAAVLAGRGATGKGAQAPDFAAPVYGSAAEIGREIAAMWAAFDRADETTRHAKSDPARQRRGRLMGRAADDCREALEDVLTATQARTVDDALVQALVAIGDVDILGDDGSEEFMEERRARVMALLHSVARFLAEQTTTDPAEFGAAAYMRELVEKGGAE